MILRGPRTKWGIALVAIYSLAVVFSLLALFLTVLALSNLPSTGEEVPSTRGLFLNFGLFWGALIQVAVISITILVPPLLLLYLLRLLPKYSAGNPRLLSAVTIGGWSFIDAFALSSLISSFLNFYHDNTILTFVVDQDIAGALQLNGEYEFIKNVGLQILFVAFFAFLAVRLTLYSRKQERNSDTPYSRSDKK